jgi:hypothetical protein
MTLATDRHSLAGWVLAALGILLAANTFAGQLEQASRRQAAPEQHAARLQSSLRAQPASAAEARPARAAEEIRRPAGLPKKPLQPPSDPGLAQHEERLSAQHEELAATRGQLTQAEDRFRGFVSEPGQARAAVARQPQSGSALRARR